MEDLFNRLEGYFPDAHCELNSQSDFELLVAVMLSAQCTDKRVNAVTPALFEIAPTAEAMDRLPIETLETYIKSCGLYRTKAKNIKAAAHSIVTDYGGEVPRTMDELLKLAGVGRKTANVVMSVAFDTPALAVDTHVFRVAHRLGLSNGRTPYDVERDLTALLDEQDFKKAHHLLIFFGRYCCKARNPDCTNCPVKQYCKNPPL